MAVVYAGWHEQLERPVALKVLASHLAGDEHFRTRFLREARIASKLHHPNLVRTYDIAELDGQPVHRHGAAARRHARGRAADPAGSRRRRLRPRARARARRRAPRPEAGEPPARRATAVVKIADFGIARAVEETRVTQIGTVLGTLRYLAPEQAEGREVGPEADVYSLGVVLDELLAAPSRADRALIERCLQPDPRDRPTAAGGRGGAARREHDRRADTGAPARQTADPARRPLLDRPGQLLAALALIVAAVAIASRAAAGRSASSRCRTRRRPRSRRATSAPGSTRTRARPFPTPRRSRSSASCRR